MWLSPPVSVRTRCAREKPETAVGGRIHAGRLQVFAHDRVLQLEIAALGIRACGAADVAGGEQQRQQNGDADGKQKTNAHLRSLRTTTGHDLRSALRKRAICELRVVM